MHHHEYDEAGRLVRTVVEREPEWDDEARDWLLGLALREDAECRRCGGLLSETTDPELSWVPAAPIVCLRCVSLHNVEEQHSKSPWRSGAIHRVEKRQRRKIQPKARRTDGDRAG